MGGPQGTWMNLKAKCAALTCFDSVIKGDGNSGQEVADCKGEEGERKSLNRAENEQNSDGGRGGRREVREIHWFNILISDACSSLQVPLCQTHFLLGTSPFSFKPATQISAASSHRWFVSWLLPACSDPFRPADLPHSLGPDPILHSLSWH